MPDSAVQHMFAVMSLMPPQSLHHTSVISFRLDDSELPMFTNLPVSTGTKRVLPALVHPAAYVGDFSSHHPEWGYSEPDEDGEALVEWASNSDLTLTHVAKQRGTFYSARWQKDYSPDLCWVTSIGDHPQPASQTVLGDFPHSQHRPLLIHIGLQLPIIHGSSKKRWNFRKADWDFFSSKLERSVVTIPSRCIPIEEAYQHFQGAIFSAATTAIPRGCRPVYTPCLDMECQALLEEYEGSGNLEIADHLIESLDAARPGLPNSFLEPPHHCTFCMSPLSITPDSTHKLISSNSKT